jgi:phospholipase/carboxylesterase
VTDDGDPDDPHADGPMVTAGAPAAAAEAAAVLVHGRGSSPGAFVRFADRFHRRGVAYYAPGARRGSWYPNRFLAPIASNEPGLSSGLRAVGRAVAAAGEAGVPPDRVLVVGFSQGACLAAEYVARTPRRYGGLGVWSGGLVGPPGTTFDHEGDLAGTPVYVECSDVDPHIPLDRVHETAAVFEGMGAAVEERIVPGGDHVVTDAELDWAGARLDALLAAAREGDDADVDGR